MPTRLLSCVSVHQHIQIRKTTFILFIITEYKPTYLPAKIATSNLDKIQKSLIEDTITKATPTSKQH